MLFSYILLAIFIPEIRGQRTGKRHKSPLKLLSLKSTCSMKQVREDDSILCALQLTL